VRPPELCFSEETKRLAKERAGNVCEGCGKPGSKTRLEVDHLIPIWFAQHYPMFAPAVINSLANSRILCPDCHSKRMHYEVDEILMLAHGVMARYVEEIKGNKTTK
jgi:5-methylcytosine-specific restriction endonuclease McrA